MRKTFRYRLFPTKKQSSQLNRHLEECRWLYNHFLEKRKTVYQETGETVGYYDQQNTIPALKIQRPSLSRIHSQVLQNIATRVDLAFKEFFRRLKSGSKPGYPRFRGEGRYDSITFPQVPSGCELKGNYLRLSKIGTVKVVLHRKMEGKPKTCTIKKSSTGKWYACFSCEVITQRLPASDNTKVGVDVGLISFATLSTGESIDNPHFFRLDEKVLVKAQQSLSKEPKGTQEFAKKRKVVARIHERVTFRRHDFAHQVARSIVDRFGFIAVEDLEVNRMLHNHCLAKSISDAAWSLFFTLLFFKAECAGRTIVRVNPAYTTQDCSQCGHRQKLALSKREFHCPCCQLVLNRDHNAALNIVRIGLGQQTLGTVPKKSRP